MGNSTKRDTRGQEMMSKTHEATFDLTKLFDPRMVGLHKFVAPQVVNESPTPPATTNRTPVEKWEDALESNDPRNTLALSLYLMEKHWTHLYKRCIRDAETKEQRRQITQEYELDIKRIECARALLNKTFA